MSYEDTDTRDKQTTGYPSFLMLVSRDSVISHTHVDKITNIAYNKSTYDKGVLRCPRTNWKELILKNHGYITTQDAKQEGIHREYLTMFVEEEKLIRGHLKKPVNARSMGR